MLVSYVPLLFVLIGVLMYALAANPKLVEIGRIMYAMAFLATMLTFAQHTFHLGG